MEQADLNSAHLFVEVVRQRSFTAAASALGLPKSTVSRKVSELESRLGARLIERTTRQLRLTDLGTRYFERVNRLVHEFSEAEAAVIDAQGTPKGQLRVTAPPDLGTSFLPMILPQFARNYPEIQVVIDLTNTYRDLVGEGYDVAIRAGRLSESSLIAKPLLSGTFELYASPSYLEEKGRPGSVLDLTKHDCLVFGTEAGQRWDLEGPDGNASLLIQGRTAAKDFGFLRMAAVMGGGIALLPNFLVGPDLHRGALEKVLPGYSRTADTLYLVYPSKQFLPPKTRAFVDFMTEQFHSWERILAEGCPKACLANGEPPSQR
jgi:DNA-binding transcriptional LysR family regulator